MTIKKLTLCILCFMNAANLATDEDFNNENSLNSEVEENVLINKNDWNTRKWGDIYFLFPHLSVCNIILKIISVTKSAPDKRKNDSSMSFLGTVKQMPLRFLNSLLSGVIEYKYMFHKYYGINVRLNLNNLEAYIGDEVSFFSFEPSLEWIWKRKGKKIFSVSFSPLGFAYVQDGKGSRAEDFFKKMCTLGFVLLKYEYDRRFYLNFGKVKTMWYSLKNICEEDFWQSIGCSLVSIEFGLNIIGVNDWRKKRKIENIGI